METLNVISSIASILGLLLSVVIVYLSITMPSAIRKYSQVIEYNKQRRNLMNKFEADLLLLTDKERPLNNPSLIKQLYNNIYALESYSKILDKKTRETINISLELIRSEKEENRNKLIENITILKNFCSKEREYFYEFTKNSRSN